MRKTKATKKSGTIAYQLNPRYDLQGEATEKNPLMGVSVVASTPVTTKEMAERIGFATSVNKVDVVAVLTALGHELSRALLDGRTVQIDEIGSFGLKQALTSNVVHQLSSIVHHPSTLQRSESNDKIT